MSTRRYAFLVRHLVRCQRLRFHLNGARFESLPIIAAWSAMAFPACKYGRASTGYFIRSFFELLLNPIWVFISWLMSQSLTGEY